MSETRPSRDEMCVLPMDVRWAVKAMRASAVRCGSGGGGGGAGGAGGGCSTWVAEEVEVVMLSGGCAMEASCIVGWDGVRWRQQQQNPTFKAACRSAEPHRIIGMLFITIYQSGTSIQLHSNTVLQLY